MESFYRKEGGQEVTAKETKGLFQARVTLKGKSKKVLSCRLPHLLLREGKEGKGPCDRLHH